MRARLICVGKPKNQHTTALYDDFEDGVFDPTKWSCSASDGADAPSETGGELVFTSSGPIAVESLVQCDLLAPGLVGVSNPIGVRGVVELTTTEDDTFLDIAVDAEDAGGDPGASTTERQICGQGQSAPLHTFASVWMPPET